MDYPDVNDNQREIVATYGHLLVNTGGNDPLDLLQRLQWPGDGARKNRLMTTNVVVFILATGVQAQVTLLARLKKEGLI